VRAARSFVVQFAFGLLASGPLTVGCGHGSVADPFAKQGHGPDGGGGEGGASAGAGGEAPGPPPLAGAEPCVDDSECDDGVDCTLDSCNGRLRRCVHAPDDSRCDDGVYCDGTETCSASLGCQQGPVVSCSDEFTCTIDICVEETKSCKHEPRDADGDGDPPISCGGTDCNDFNPLVSGKAAEICGNGIDDNCNGQVDEADCVMPLYDRCGDALEIDAAGSYSVSTVGAAKDYAISCEQKSNSGAFREVVLAITVPDDGPRDVDIVGVMQQNGPRLQDGELVLAGTDQCGKASGETVCVQGVETAGDDTARLLLRSLAPGAHAVYVATDQEANVELHVDFRAPSPPPANETCGTSQTLVPGVPVDVLLAGLDTDLDTACRARTGELVYDFDLPEAADVHLQAVALDAYGDPLISLRDAACVRDKDEITCRAASPAALFARALPAGHYTVALAGTGPAEVELVLSVSAPTDAPPTQGCAHPPALEPGVTEQVSLADATDAVQIGCLVGAPDATYALALAERSDVLLVEQGSAGDTGGLLVAEAPCASTADSDACQSSDQWPVRAVAHRVGPGSVRAVVETSAGNPATLTAFTRPAVSSVFVQGADECADALAIPETGGRFEGNTANEYAQYEASCDYGGQGPGGAPEQMLTLTLTARRRVILDASGSSYRTLLVVRQTDGCPGDEVADTCSVTYTASGSDVPTFSFVDTTLDPGTYYVQIDGYNGDSGRWALEVFTSAVSQGASE
jgi:hypothetical protein